jgi:regulator of protease activity HflC (stomatin/prohibitin superfamily)
VPLDDREQALLFHARTADFQDVVVQATINYRVVDPALATTRVDFGVNPESGAWNGVPLETLGGLLTELAQQPALELLAQMIMKEALAVGIGPVRQEITVALANDSRLAERGIAVTDVRVVAIRADAELERAMQTETREMVQQDADRATFERRAVAVERERAIAENELKNQIELARREEELVGRRGQNERKRAGEQAAAEAIAAEAKAAQRRLAADAEADATRVLGDARAEAETARYGAYAEVDTSVILGLAVQELAKNVPDIDNLTITPDLLTPILTRFSGGGATDSADVDAA